MTGSKLDSEFLKDRIDDKKSNNLKDQKQVRIETYDKLQSTKFEYELKKKELSGQTKTIKQTVGPQESKSSTTPVITESNVVKMKPGVGHPYPHIYTKEGALKKDKPAKKPTFTPKEVQKSSIKLHKVNIINSKQ